MVDLVVVSEEHFYLHLQHDGIHCPWNNSITLKTEVICSLKTFWCYSVIIHSVKTHKTIILFVLFAALCSFRINIKSYLNGMAREFCQLENNFCNSHEHYCQFFYL
jgi:hypothetical protein